ncbi:MAG: hypothetical protein LBI43_00625 [Streptococcaceae bacterium]|jgi:hypothetical protein|nr:hypothetical protein [Streptococcaceae bacterium]
MKRWLITPGNAANDQSSAFGKAYSDVAEIAQTQGYQLLTITPFQVDETSDAVLISRIDGLTAGVSADDFLVYQYPTFLGARFDYTFVDHLRARGARVILFIHDVFALFLSADGKGYHDMDFFNHADLLITHGSQMTRWLRDHDVTTPMVDKPLFDYLLPEKNNIAHEIPQRRLVITGNLLKSQDLTHWESNTPLDAYGRTSIVGVDGVEQHMSLSPQITYHGALLQDELLSQLPKNAFGLVWDSDVPVAPFSNVNFYGFYKHYNKYNNPHKASLYLAMGLPLVVWQEAAIAKLVLDYNLGFTIQAPSEIDARLSALTDEKLSHYSKQAQFFSALLRAGYFTRQALLDAEKSILFKLLERRE